MFRTVLPALAALVLAGGAHAAVIEKGPDAGPFWQPLSPTGTFIYANSFVAEDSGAVTDLGFWARGSGGTPGSSQVVFEVYGAGPAPDSTDVIAQTARIDVALGSTLDFYSAPTLFGAALTPGETYWFAANVIGGVASVAMQVGAHTQNSVYSDNGTFWYSNDPTGINFDGRNLTPEMAFRVITGDTPRIPVPAALPLAASGLVLLGLLRRRAAS